HPDAPVPEHNAFRSQPLLDSVLEDHLHVAAVYGELWPRITGGLAGRLGVDKLAVTVEVGRVLRGDGDGRKLVDKTQLVQLGDRLVNSAVDADLLHAQRQHQASGAGADDQDVRVPAHGCCSSLCVAGIG